MIGIIDYGAGNLASIQNMLRRVEVDSIITSDVDALASVDKLILPGVGAFDRGIENLHKSGLWDILNTRVLQDKVPILGICLGVQLFTEGSDEGTAEGLGWIKGRTVAFDRAKLSDTQKVPNMGWRNIEIQKDTPVTRDLPQDPRFYFVHSFHLQCEHPEDVIVTSHHGYEIQVGVQKDNIIGLQFHPEKSHKFGMKLLTNFANSH